MTSIDSELRYSNNIGSRDLRFDWMRGYAVMVMIIDHLGKSSIFHIFTGANRFYISGADVFVVISGIIVGIVYGSLLRRENIKAVILKACKRALTIYVLVLFLSFVVVLFGLYVKSPWTDELPPKLSWFFVFQVVTLRRTFDFVDIPLLYVFLLLATPFGLYLVHTGKTWLLITLSWLLWLAYQFPAIGIFIPPFVTHNGVFKFQTWQLLFFMSMIIGYHRETITQKIASVNRKALMAYFAVLAAIVFVMVVVFLVRFVEPTKALSTSITENRSIVDLLFSKKMLGVGRLLAIVIVFQFVFFALTFYWQRIIRLTSWLIPYGQNSLYAYTLHVFLIMGFIALTPHFAAFSDYAIVLNSAYQLIAVILVCWLINYRFLLSKILRLRR